MRAPLISSEGARLGSSAAVVGDDGSSINSLQTSAILRNSARIHGVLSIAASTSPPPNGRSAELTP